jgi:hypothetical protein
VAATLLYAESRPTEKIGVQGEATGGPRGLKVKIPTRGDQFSLGYGGRRSPHQTPFGQRTVELHPLLGFACRGLARLIAMGRWNSLFYDIIKKLFGSFRGLIFDYLNKSFHWRNAFICAQRRIGRSVGHAARADCIQ